MVRISDFDHNEYLRPDAVEPEMIVTIVDEGEVISAEQSMYGKARLNIGVDLGNGIVKLLPLNPTSWRKLAEGYGDDTQMWISKRIRLKVVTMNVNGVERKVIFAYPLDEDACMKGST